MVDFVIELLWALLLVTAPIFIFSLALVWWALQKGNLKEGLDGKALRRELNAMTKKGKKKGADKEVSEHKKGDIIQNKWAKFGGGFYGVVAFFTYLVIEIRDIFTTIMNIGGLLDFIRHLDIGVIIGMFISALTNFIAAMAWPWFWMKRLDTPHTWVWFALAYAGYWLGIYTAQRLYQRHGVIRKISP